MTTDQENKIIQQAQDIMARRFAVENELKLNAQSVAYYGAYYLGVRRASPIMVPTIWEPYKRCKR